jgi:hypothetical protein
MQIAAVAARRHAAGDHAVGERDQIDPEQHRSALDHGRVTALRLRRRGVN